MPSRLAFSVERLGVADYFNPRRYWFWVNGGLRSDHPMGYAHNASFFTRAAFEAVGGAPREPRRFTGSEGHEWPTHDHSIVDERP